MAGATRWSEALVEACMSDDRLDGHTVLFVEDEPFILEDVKTALEEAGGNVIPAQSVREARSPRCRSDHRIGIGF
jgi:hypothetical protein